MFLKLNFTKYKAHESLITEGYCWNGNDKWDEWYEWNSSVEYEDKVDRQQPNLDLKRFRLKWFIFNIIN